MGQVSLYGDVDRNQKGEVSSEWPAWYNRNHIEDIEENVREMKIRLERGLVPNDSVPDHKQAILDLENKLLKIKDSFPNLGEEERDRLAKVRKWLGVNITMWQFSKDDMMTGEADPHEEARRRSEPIIKIENQEIADVLKSCNIDNFHGKGMITRDQAEKAWKLASKQLGEPSNTELLRPRKK